MTLWGLRRLTSLEVAGLKQISKVAGDMVELLLISQIHNSLVKATEETVQRLSSYTALTEDTSWFPAPISSTSKLHVAPPPSPVDHIDLLL